MIQDALICRKVNDGWRWCVVPLDVLDAFRARGWVLVLSTDSMTAERERDITETRIADEQKPILNRPRFRDTACNGE